MLMLAALTPRDLLTALVKMDLMEMETNALVAILKIMSAFIDYLFVSLLVYLFVC